MFMAQMLVGTFQLSWKFPTQIYSCIKTGDEIKGLEVWKREGETEKENKSKAEADTECGGKLL